LFDTVIFALVIVRDLITDYRVNVRTIVGFRFYGSATGVFRMFPGAPMLNTFDHRQTDW